MTYLITGFFLRLKQLLFNKKIFAVMMTIMIISLFCVNKGVNEYHHTVSISEDFKKQEEIIFTRIMDYDKYSVYGVRVNFIPAGASVFFSNPDIMSELYARVNSIVTMDIYNNTKNRSLFKKKFPFPLRYSIILLILGSIFTLILGYKPMLQKEFLKSLCSTSTHFKIYFLEIAPRLFVIILSLVFITAINLCFALVRNIDFTKTDIYGLLGHLLTALLMLTAFFAAGVIIGILTRVKWIGTILILSFLGVFMVGLPLIINSIIEKKAEKLTSSYKVETQKLEVISDFEKMISETLGKYSKEKNELFRNAAEKYYIEEHEQIVGFEKKMRDEFLELIKQQESLCILTPVTFYLATNDEASSRGYLVYIDFYDYIILLHKNFLRFWIDHVYYGNPKVMINFVKAGENIFKSTSRLPNKYWTGVLVNTVYNLILFLASFLAFKITMFRSRSKEFSPMGKVAIKMKNGDFKEYSVKDETFNNLLYNLFSRRIPAVKKEGFQGEVLVNGVNIALEIFKQGFIYIHGLEHLPTDLKAKEYIATYANLLKLNSNEKRSILHSTEISPLVNKTIARLSQMEKFVVLLTLMQVKKKQVYLVNDIDNGLHHAFSIKLKERMDQLKEQGALVIFLTTLVISKDEKKEKIFEETTRWQYLVEENKKLIEMRKKIEQEQRKKD